MSQRKINKSPSESERVKGVRASHGSTATMTSRCELVMGGEKMKSRNEGM